MPAHPFSLKSPDQHWDVIVIGSGMGGMTTAAFLSRLGKKVLVLEQHYVPGGFTHEFKRQHWSFDVGVHAIGEVTSKSLLGRLLKALAGDELKWASLGDHYEEFYFPDGLRLNFPNHPHKFKEHLKAAFPKEAEAVDRFIDLTKASQLSFKKYCMGRVLPRPLGAALDRLTDVSRYFGQTTQSFLDQLSDDERFKAVLAAQWGYYGALPQESAFGIQALINRHYAYGAYYPVGGAKSIAAALLKTLAQNQGWTRVRASVDSVLVDGDRAVGVRLKSGEELKALRVVSAVGVMATLERLLPHHNSAVLHFAAKLSKLRPAPCHICLYLGFEGDIRQAGAGTANQWFWETWRSKEQIWDFRNGDEKPGALYMSYPSLKDPNHQGPFHTAEVVAFVPYEAFTNWSHSKTQHRGESYQQLKQELTERILAVVFTRMPGLKPLMRYSELSTPLSTEHYTRAYQGSIYGVLPTPERFLNSWLRPKTPLKNFYLAGCDVGVAGVMGAMLGGVMGTIAMEPRPALRFIRALG